MDFANKPLEWNAVGVEPDQDKKDLGFEKDEYPAAGHFDRMFNATYLAIKELQENVIGNTDIVVFSDNDVAPAKLAADFKNGTTKSLIPTGVNTLYNSWVTVVEDTTNIVSSSQTPYRFEITTIKADNNALQIVDAFDHVNSPGKKMFTITRITNITTGAWLSWQVAGDSSKVDELKQELTSHKAEYAKLATDVDTLKKLRKERSNKDSNGIFTTITYKRKSDGTVYAKSVLSGGTAPQYTTRTETFYDVDGTTVLATIPYAISYDADGDWVGEV